MATRKRRTREHVLEDLSENHLERMVLDCGYLLRRPSRDYGVDVTMFHFSDEGELENGEVRFQLKATDSINLVKEGKFASIQIKTGDIQYWLMEFYPFIPVLYDAQKERAYWLDIKELASGSLDLDRESVKIRIPISNKLTAGSIKRFRKESLSIIQQMESGDDDRQSKPR